MTSLSGWSSALVTALLLAACVFYHTAHPATHADSAHGQAKLAARASFGDELGSRPADQRLPAKLRGDTPGERVHYMESIAPRSERDWVSACVAPEAEQAQRQAHAHRAHPVAAQSAKRQERSMLQQVERDAEGKHAYPASHRMLHEDGEEEEELQLRRRSRSAWTDRRNPFAFRAHQGRGPRRNPALACLYSDSFRDAHADQCAEYAKGAPRAAGQQEQEVELEAPFKSVGYVLRPGRDRSCGAWGWFSNELHTSGWNYLHVETNRALSDMEQARAAGFLEGSLTAQQIFEHRTNEFFTLFPNQGVISEQTKGFISDMTTFNLQMVATHADTDPYWMQVGLMYQQLQGMADGFAAGNTNSSRSVSYGDLLLLQYDGDMTDIQAAVAPPSERVTTDAPLQQIMEYLIRNGHCSALIKLTEGNEELFMAHDTWAGFASTHRMFKAYRLHYSAVATSAVHFSSYPGYLSSTDDFYQTLETRLAVIETTNDIINNKLYDLVDSASVPTWTRAMVATRLATGGKEWTAYFGAFQSGTYNNQWMVLDYSKFTVGAPIQPDTLWILEVMPGSVYSLDVSAVLADRGYWASYNRPYITPIYTSMGYAALNVTYGPYLFGYDRYFRAEIFRREQPGVAALGDMQRVMSLNRWQTDPLSKNNSGFAVSARFDLSTFDPVPSLGFFYRGAWGAYDVKITSNSWMENRHLESDDGASAHAAASAAHSRTMRVSTINGPTHRDQPAFTWLDPEWTNYASHVGLPETYDFDFLQFHL